MKTLKRITLLIICSLSFNISYAQSPVNSVGSGCALSFNGVSNYVELNSTINLQFDNNPFTIQMWIKTLANTSGGLQQLWISGYVGTTPYDLEIIVNNNRILLHVRDNLSNQFSLVGNQLINDDKWHQITIVRSVGLYSIYVDGIIDASGNSSVIGDIDNSLASARIGQITIVPTNRYFNGNIDEVRAWNKALTQTEIQQNMCKKLTGNELGLVGYWRFDDCGGLTTADASGNGNTGTLN